MAKKKLSRLELRGRLVGELSAAELRDISNRVDCGEWSGLLIDAADLLRDYAGGMPSSGDLLAIAAHRVAGALCRVETDFHSGAARTFDQALGRTRPKKWRQDAALREAKYGLVVLLQVEAIRNRRGSKRTLAAAFDEVSKALPFGSDKVKKLYYAAKREHEAFRAQE